MNWRDFLVLAGRLGGGAAEAEWRSAVSRAYYAAFHVARLLLSDLKFTIPRADRHINTLYFASATAANLPWNGRGATWIRCGGCGTGRTMTKRPLSRGPRLPPPFRSPKMIQALDDAQQAPARTGSRMP